MGRRLGRTARLPFKEPPANRWWLLSLWACTPGAALQVTSSVTGSISPRAAALPLWPKPGAWSWELTPSKNRASGHPNSSRKSGALSWQCTGSAEIASQIRPSASTPPAFRICRFAKLSRKAGCRCPGFTSNGPECVIRVAAPSVLTAASVSRTKALTS